MSFGLVSRSIKLAFEVTIFVLLTVYLVVEKEAPSREYIFVIWLLYFILCSTNFSEYTFNIDKKMKDMHYKIKNHNVTCDDIEDISNIIKDVINDIDYGFTLGSNDDSHIVIEIKKLWP